jgi:hypothetical protein
MKRYPKLLGQPSPSLAIMSKMSPSELTTHLERLRAEGERIAHRIQSLKVCTPTPARQIEHLTKLQQRLEALLQAGRDLAARRPDDRFRLPASQGYTRSPSPRWSSRM